MLPLRPYHPGTYPPKGPQWVQFGDDIVEHTLTAAEKRENRRQDAVNFHSDRLEQDGLTPMNLAPQLHSNTHSHMRHEAAVAAHNPIFHDIDDAGVATISPPSSPRHTLDLREPLARVRRAGVSFAHTAKSHISSAIQNNTRDGLELAKQGYQAAGQIASAIGTSSKRTASSSVKRVYKTATEVGDALAVGASSRAAHAHTLVNSAMEPGSETRQTISSAASSTGRGLATAASVTAGGLGQVGGGVKHVLQVAGPPVVHGGYLVAAGAGSLVKDAVIGAKDLTVAAKNATSTHVIPAAKHYASRAVDIFNQAVLSASDIIEGLNAMERHDHYSAHNALENGHHEAIGNGPTSRSRTDTPPRKKRVVHADQAVPKPKFEHTYDTEQEWLKYSHNRGILVEELYKRPNWTEFTKGFSGKNDLRKKLLTMTPNDLAKILVSLDHR